MYNKKMSMYRGHASKVQDAFEMMQGRQMASIKYVHVYNLKDIKFLPS